MRWIFSIFLAVNLSAQVVSPSLGWYPKDALAVVDSQQGIAFDWARQLTPTSTNISYTLTTKGMAVRLNSLASTTWVRLAAGCLLPTNGTVELIASFPATTGYLLQHFTGASPRLYLYSPGSGISYSFTGRLGNGGSVYSSAGQPYNTWTHVVIVYSGNTLYFYTNGQAVGSGAGTALDAPGALSIGDGGNTNPSLQTNLLTRTYSRALSSAEILALYKEVQSEIP